MNLDKFKQQVNQRRLCALQRISKIPIAALIWGPNPISGSRLASTRNLVRETLRNDGVYACFSEELYDATIPYSNRAQQVAQAEAFDVVFSIPDSPGSIAEIHDFAIIPRISPKIVAFLDEAWNDGYASKSLLELQSPLSCHVKLYKGEHLPNCIIDECAGVVRKLREGFYIVGRR
jgi:hypothetical protein